MISIIVPVYNAANYVSRTIDNLLQQDVEGKFKHKPNSDNVSKKNNKFTRIFKSQI